MKYYDWDEKKNKLLKKKRGISFEEVVLSIADGRLLDILEHHDQTKYPNQKLFIVEVRQYAYIVPFVERDESYFLKTIYPSRKATKTYLTSEE
jgi:uncharacterized DUF497 family protein